MATFSEIYQIAFDGTFQQSVRYAVSKAAVDIAAEAVSVTVPKVTAKRQAKATSVLNGTENWMNWALTIMTNPTFQSNGVTPADADLPYVIGTIWDAMAGVTAEDKIVIEPE